MRLDCITTPFPLKCILSLMDGPLRKKKLLSPGGLLGQGKCGRYTSLKGLMSVKYVSRTYWVNKILAKPRFHQSQVWQIIWLHINLSYVWQYTILCFIGMLDLTIISYKLTTKCQVTYNNTLLIILTIRLIPYKRRLFMLGTRFLI